METALSTKPTKTEKIFLPDNLLKKMKPSIYVHRIGREYPTYMTSENEKLLNSFAEFRSGGSRETPLSSDELASELDGAEAILSLNGIGSQEINTEILNKVGTVKLAVISHWYHNRHEISKAMWEAAGVKVIEGAVANTEAVAEWTVASMLMGVRNLPYYDRILRKGWTAGSAADWDREREKSKLLCEATIGLIGLGRIGLQVATLLKPFQTKVRGYDPFISREIAAQHGVELASLEDVFKSSDVISFHLPVNEKTRGMLGEKELRLIKDGAVVLNCARAGLFDITAWMDELQKARFTAFVDVFEKEPLPVDHPIKQMNHVFITPHIAGYSSCALQRCARQAILTLKDYFSGNLKLT